NDDRQAGHVEPVTPRIGIWSTTRAADRRPLAHLSFSWPLTRKLSRGFALSQSRRVGLSPLAVVTRLRRALGDTDVGAVAEDPAPPYAAVGRDRNGNALGARSPCQSQSHHHRDHSHHGHAHPFCRWLAPDGAHARVTPS